MKDQRKLVTRCIQNDVPVFVLSGKDKLALKTIEYYYKLAIENNCDKEFTEDLKCLVEHFRDFQSENEPLIKLPD